MQVTAPDDSRVEPRAISWAACVSSAPIRQLVDKVNLIVIVTRALLRVAHRGAALTDTPLEARVAAIRRFNRFYTRQIGALREGLLDSEFSLTEARVLYELAQGAGSITATDIGRTLGLDPGYLSRMLRTFEERRLVQRRPSTSDARRSNLALTQKGRSAFARLDALARAEIADVLRGHSAADQRTLVRAMHSIERVLASTELEPRTLELRDPRPGDMGWVIERHGEIYAD